MSAFSIQSSYNRDLKGRTGGQTNSAKHNQEYSFFRASTDNNNSAHFKCKANVCMGFCITFNGKSKDFSAHILSTSRL